MTKAELKKEYRKKCRAEKAKSYRYHLIGGIICVICFLFIIPVFILDNFTDTFQNLYPLQIICYLGCIPFAIAAIVFDLLGDNAFKQGFREYLEEKQRS